MRRRWTALAIAAAAVMTVGAGTNGPGERSQHRSATWRGATVADGWAGWLKREVVRGRAIAARVEGVDATAYTVRPGDVPGKSGERSEVSASVSASAASPGNAVRYRWSTWFPGDFRPAPDSTWTIFTQFHESEPDGCHPNIALQVNARDGVERLRLTVRGGLLDARTCEPGTSESWDFAPLERDRWHRFDLLVGWSASTRLGFVELTMDGVTVVRRTAHATLYRGQSAYLKQGLYRAPADYSSTILHSAITRGAPVPIDSLPAL